MFLRYNQFLTAEEADKVYAHVLDTQEDKLKTYQTGHDTYTKTLTEIHYAADGRKQVSNTYWNTIVYDINGVIKTYSNSHMIDYMI